MGRASGRRAPHRSVPQHSSSEELAQQVAQEEAGDVPVVAVGADDEEDDNYQDEDKAE